MSGNKKILLVENDLESRNLLKAIFNSEGFDTLIAGDGREAIDILEKDKADIVISGILMPQVNGYNLCLNMRADERLRNIPIIIYSTTFTDSGEEAIAEEMGADLFIRKPASSDVLRQAVHDLLATPGNRPNKEVSRLSSSELIDKLEKRNLSLEQANEKLQRLVYESTRSLNETNEELLASNEELRAANEELMALNDQLEMASKQIQEQSEIIIRQKEEALKRSEQSLQILFSTTIEEIAILDHAGRILSFNNSLEKFITMASGRKPAIGDYIWDITVPDRRENSKFLFDRARNGESVEVEAVVRTLSGKDVIHHLRYSPVFVDNRVSYVTLISTDITEKKKQEDQLRKSEANLRALFDNTTDSFTLIDADLKIIAFNQNNFRHVKTLMGIDLSVGESFLRTLPQDRHDVFITLINKVKRKGSVKTITRYPEGETEKWFEITITPVRGTHESIIGYCITAHDTTEIKEAEGEILRLNKSLLDFQNAIHRSSIVSTTDCKGLIELINENFTLVSGYSKDEIVGKTHRLVNSGYHAEEFWKEMWETISNGRMWRGQVKNKSREGQEYWIDLFIMPFVNDKNEIVQYLSIAHDISDRKKAEEELIEKRALLEEATSIARIGYWVRDKRTGLVSISKEMFSILMVSEDDFAADPNALYKNVFPPDVEKIVKLTDEAAYARNTFQSEYRILKPDGSIRWIDQKVDFTKTFSHPEKVIGIIQDITDRKTIEEVLLQYNERYEILSKATNDAIWDLDIQLDLIVWNHAIHELFGYDKTQVKYTRGWWISKAHPDDREQLLNAFEKAIRDRETNWRATFRFECADGSYKNVFNRSYILYENGKAIRVIGALQDITERMNAVAEIEKLSLVASKTNNAVMITDQDGRIEWVNESFVKLSGYSLEEVKGRKSNFLQGKETDQFTVARISERLKKRQLISEEIINYTKSGDKYWSKLDIVPVFNDQNVLKNFVSIQTDITELKEFEHSITSIARELASLIENANVPIFGVDKAGAFNEWNGVTTSLTGYDRMDMMGMLWEQSFMSETGRAIIGTLVKEAFDGKATANIELPLITKEGKRLILLVSASPRRSVAREITGIIFVGQNITELSEYRHDLERKVADRTRELHVALTKEKELVQLKSQFVSIASHEFRTPLSSIAIASGFVKKYKTNLTSEQIDEKLENIEKQVSHMTFLLDDILTIGKAEAGKIPVTKKEIRIHPFFENLCREVERTTGGTHIIRLSNGVETDRLIASDEKLLRNIVINLLTNAIKFSPRSKHVDLNLQFYDDEFAIEVKDHGIGIPEKDIKNLFEPFFRGGNVGAIQGTGLGLSIIKKAVSLLDGRVTVKSDLGRGTEIKIRLPL